MAVSVADHPAPFLIHGTAAYDVVDGRDALTRAEVYVAAPKLAWWTDEAAMRRQPVDEREGFRLAQAIAEAYGERLRAFDPVTRSPTARNYCPTCGPWPPTGTRPATLCA